MPCMLNMPALQASLVTSTRFPRAHDLWHAPARFRVCSAAHGEQTGGTGDEPEDAAYNELLARRREERKQAIREASRRTRFNTLNRKTADKPAPQGTPNQQQKPQQQLQQQPDSHAPSSQPPPPPPVSTPADIAQAIGLPGQRPAPKAQQRAGGAPLRQSLSRRKGGSKGLSGATSRKAMNLRQRRQLTMAGEFVPGHVHEL